MTYSIKTSEYASYLSIAEMLGYDLNINVVTAADDGILIYDSLKITKHKYTGDFVHAIYFQEEILRKVTSSVIKVKQLVISRNVKIYGSVASLGGWKSQVLNIKYIKMLSNNHLHNNNPKIEDLFYASCEGSSMPFSLLSSVNNGSFANDIYNSMLKAKGFTKTTKGTLKKDFFKVKKKKKALHLKVGDNVTLVKKGKLSGEKYNWVNKCGINVGDKLEVTAVHDKLQISVKGFEMIAFNKYHFKKIKNE